MSSTQAPSKQILMSDMFTQDNDVGFRRLKVQSLGFEKDAIAQGLGFSTQWYESAIAANAQVYSEFVVPVGVYLVVDFRFIQTDSDKIFYRVYGEGSYVAGTDKTDTINNYTRTRKLRQDGLLEADPLRRINITTAPTFFDFIQSVPVLGVSGSGSGNKSSGNLETDTSAILLSPDQSFLLQIDNQGAGAGDVEILLNYALIPADLVREISA
jgi:hypothetical protein